MPSHDFKAAKTGTADPKLKQQLVVKLPKVGGKKLKSIPSQGNSH